MIVCDYAPTPRLSNNKSIGRFTLCDTRQVDPSDPRLGVSAYQLAFTAEELNEIFWRVAAWDIDASSWGITDPDVVATVSGLSNHNFTGASVYVPTLQAQSANPDSASIAGTSSTETLYSSPALPLGKLLVSLFGGTILFNGTDYFPPIGAKYAGVSDPGGVPESFGMDAASVATGTPAPGGTLTILGKTANMFYDSSSSLTPGVVAISIASEW